MSTKKTQDNMTQTLNPVGYVNRREITNLPGVFLVKGSKNCIIENKEKVSSRKGYTLVGAAKTENVGVVGSYDWETHLNTTRSVRVRDDGDYEVYYGGTWYLVKSFGSSPKPNFAEWWDDAEQIDMLLAVDGLTDGIHMWSGAIAEIASATGTTLTLASGTWAELGFLTSGTRKVVIDGAEYEYTGGETTDTLTGLSGLPTMSSGDVVIQAVRISTPATLDGLTLGLIESHHNYVFYGDTQHRKVYMSANDDYTDFTYTTPLRVTGEGITFTLDSTPTAFVSGGEEEAFYISGRKDDWYKISFTLSADQGDEQVLVKKLPTSTGQAARSQGAVVRIKNGVAFLTFEPTIDTLSRVGSGAVDTPTSFPISYDIKNDITIYNLTNAHGLFYQSQIFFCLPQESTILIYDIENQMWQPPQTGLPVSRLALIDIYGDGTQHLCGHSSVSNETYHLFDGYNDNGGPISVEVHFGYENFGMRFHEKLADEFASELYMSQNTNVKAKVVYEYQGSADTREFSISGKDLSIRFAQKTGGGLGSEPLGSQPLGSLSTAVDDLAKYRVIHSTPKQDFFERQRVYTAEGIDIRFSIIAYGENIEIADSEPIHIKK